MHSTHLLVVRQPPHQLVERVVGQSPKREISHHCLDHSWVSLRETLCPGFHNQFLLDVLLKEAQKFSLFHSYVPFHSGHFEKRAPKTTRGHVIGPWGGGMLGNFQQNSRILILSIYSLSNVCNNLI